jgi:hypothetical protein
LVSCIDIIDIVDIIDIMAAFASSLVPISIETVPAHLYTPPDIVTIEDVEDMCWESLPCKHRCRVVLRDGTRARLLLPAPKIAELFWDGMPRCRQEHFQRWTSKPSKPLGPTTVTVRGRSSGLASVMDRLRGRLYGHLQALLRSWQANRARRLALRQ